MTIVEFLWQLQARVPGCVAINIRFCGEPTMTEISLFLQSDVVNAFLVDDQEWSDLPALLDDLVDWFKENTEPML